MKLIAGVYVTIALWALSECSETAANRTSEAASSDTVVELQPEPMDMGVGPQGKSREGRKEPLNNPSGDGQTTDQQQEDDESAEESEETQVVTRVPYDNEFGAESNFSQPLYEYNDKRSDLSLHSTSLNASASDSQKTKEERGSRDGEHDGDNEHDDRAAADLPRNLHPKGPRPLPLNEFQDSTSRAAPDSPAATRPSPHRPAEPHTGHQTFRPSLGRGSFYLNNRPDPRRNHYPFYHGPMRKNRGRFRPAIGPQYPSLQPQLTNDLNVLFRLPESNIGMIPGSGERFAIPLDSDTQFSRFGSHPEFRSSVNNGSRFRPNSLGLHPPVDFNRGMGPPASFRNTLNGFQHNLGFDSLISSAENEFLGFGGNTFSSSGFGNGIPRSLESYFQGRDPSNQHPMEAGDLRIQPDGLGDGATFAGQSGDVMSNAVNLHSGIMGSPLRDSGVEQTLTRHPADPPDRSQPIQPATATNALNATADSAPSMLPNLSDTRPYSVLPGGNFHSKAKSASDVHYVNRPFSKPPCASLSSRKNATFCVEDDEYPRDSVVQSAFVDPLTARRLVPYIPDEELLSAESNDVKTESAFSEACEAEIKLIRPMRAKNTKGMWKVIVNVDTPLNGQQYKQLIRTGTCRKPTAHCHSSRRSVCVQKFTMHRLAAWSPQEGLHMDSFRFPVACSCLIA